MTEEELIMQLLLSANPRYSQLITVITSLAIPACAIEKYTIIFGLQV
jgi:hypothetical protein